MNLRLSTQLHSVRACLNVARSSAFQHVWISSPPVDFRTEIAQLAADYDALAAKAALAEGATGGAADAKGAAEAALEELTYILARALALHFQRTGDLDRRGRIDLRRRDIVRLRTQDLVDKATAIRDIAVSAVAEPGAENRGITAERIEEHSRAIAAFANLMGSPRGQLANRGAILRELEEGVSALIDRLAALDDLIVQFNGTADGRRFIEAWRRARVLVDLGGGAGAPTQPESPAAVQSPSAAAQAPSAAAQATPDLPARAV